MKRGKNTTSWTINGRLKDYDDDDDDNADDNDTFWNEGMFFNFCRLQYPTRVSSVLEADFHQKVIMKFGLKDQDSGKQISAHQTFVRLTNAETKQEIIFVAEADSSNNYKFDLVGLLNS